MGISKPSKPWSRIGGRSRRCCNPKLLVQANALMPIFICAILRILDRGVNDRSNDLSSQFPCFDNALGILDGDQALAFKSPHIEGDYFWRITIDVCSSSVVRSVRKNQVSDSDESVISE